MQTNDKNIAHGDYSVSYIAEQPTIAFKKAILRTTGEVIYVRPTTKSAQSRVPLYVDADGREIAGSVLSFAPEVDWEQRRYELATAAMQGLIAGGYQWWEAEEIAKQAVKNADALINELKQK